MKPKYWFYAHLVSDNRNAVPKWALTHNPLSSLFFCLWALFHSGSLKWCPISLYPYSGRYEGLLSPVIEFPLFTGVHYSSNHRVYPFDGRRHSVDLILMFLGCHFWLITCILHGWSLIHGRPARPARPLCAFLIRPPPTPSPSFQNGICTSRASKTPAEYPQQMRIPPSAAFGAAALSDRPRAPPHTPSEPPLAPVVMLPTPSSHRTGQSGRAGSPAGASLPLVERCSCPLLTATAIVTSVPIYQPRIAVPDASTSSLAPTVAVTCACEARRRCSRACSVSTAHPPLVGTPAADASSASSPTLHGASRRRS